MSTTIGMGVKKKEIKSDDKLKLKITELEKENDKLIKKVEEAQKENESLKLKITELEKLSNK
ncbi:MAG: hypothetical protein HFJ53_01010 [Clostridia bacterium]|jgi:hypothetical protein|nr:hypothetical protein [Clostridia bacterium]